MDKEQYLKSLEGQIIWAREYVAKQAHLMTENPYFPVTLANYEGVNRITIESYDRIFFFERLAQEMLYGNGYCWKDLIIQMIELKDPKLLSQIDFGAEADTAILYCDTPEILLKAAAIIKAWCELDTTFDALLSKIDRSRIDA